MHEHENPLADDSGPAAESRRTASHRQEGDWGAIDTVGATTDQAAGQDRLLDMVGGRLVDGTAQARQHGDESERSAAAPIMGMGLGMTLAGPAFSLPVLARSGCARRLVDVVMNGSVAVHVNMDLRRRDLPGDFIEAIGRDGTVRECKRRRRHEDAGKVGERDNTRYAPCCPAGEDSKHRITAFD
jgi:hypothetical protein